MKKPLLGIALAIGFFIEMTGHNYGMVHAAGGKRQLEWEIADVPYKHPNPTKLTKVQQKELASITTQELTSLSNIVEDEKVKACGKFDLTGKIITVDSKKNNLSGPKVDFPESNITIRGFVITTSNPIGKQFISFDMSNFPRSLNGMPETLIIIGKKVQVQGFLCESTGSGKPGRFFHADTVKAIK